MDTVGPWSLVRFAHVAGAALWVGGQLALSLVILPLARRLLAPDAKDRFTAEAGGRGGVLPRAPGLAHAPPRLLPPVWPW